MKKFLLILISVLLTAATFAQNVPQAVNFSATVRDGYNNPLSNTGVTVRIAFYSGNSEIYWEEHAVTTNVNGFVSFLLNREMSDHEGSFDEIPWQSGTYTMNVQYKRTSGGEYVDLGSHELTSGFYAFTSNYALTAHTAQNLEGFAIDVAGARNGNVLVYNSETGRWEASDILSLLQAATGLTTYTITFDANGGSGIIRPQTMVASVAQAIAANTFTRTGYEFTGWNTDPDGESGTAYTDGQSITPTGDLTLYAQWRQVFTITFDANGGIGTMEPQTFSAGVAQAISTNTFTKDDYAFASWNTAADGSGISYTDGQSITISGNMTLYAQWRELRGTLNGYDWVDLGLPSGTRWATCNIGSNTPEGYGDYFAWGETSTKSTYSWATYSLCNGSNRTLTKYCSISSFGNNGFTDALTTLEASDDAATANWGSAWRMPTKEEFEELKNNCIVTWTAQNGVNGHLFTGPNGNSIFLPAAGVRDDRDLLFDGFSGYYWSSSRISDMTAWRLYFDDSGDYYVSGDLRFFGYTVRAVCQSQN